MLCAKAAPSHPLTPSAHLRYLRQPGPHRLDGVSPCSVQEIPLMRFSHPLHTDLGQLGSLRVDETKPCMGHFSSLYPQQEL